MTRRPSFSNNPVFKRPVPAPLDTPSGTGSFAPANLIFKQMRPEHLECVRKKRQTANSIEIIYSVLHPIDGGGGYNCFQFAAGIMEILRVERQTLPGRIRPEDAGRPRSACHAPRPLLFIYERSRINAVAVWRDALPVVSLSNGCASASPEH